MDMDILKFDRMATAIKVLMAAVGAFFVGLPEAVQFLFWMQLFDVVSGLLAAGKRSEVASAVAAGGIRKKVYVWLLVLVVWLLQGQFAQEFPAVIAGYSIADGVALYFGIVEAVSIVENAEKLGLPLPAFLKGALAGARGRVGYNETPRTV